MSDVTSSARWRPSPTTIAAGTCVVAGLLLTGVSWWFLLLTAVGAFGPGVARELGWLQDRDEFQVQADHRAGYHAFLATGATAFVLEAFVRSGGGGGAGDIATLLLSVLWLTWLFSSLHRYWGAPTTAARVLRTFGTVWLVFAVLSNVGSEWTGWAALLLHPLLAAPFFVLAWTGSRWPRATGALLLAASAYFVHFFGFFQGDGLAAPTRGVTFVLFVGPLLASGIALLCHVAGGDGDDQHESDDDE